jgi:hypothetical protein
MSIRGGTEKRPELARALEQLEAEGAPDLAEWFRALVGGGHLTEEMALEAITFAETLATAQVKGDLTREHGQSLTYQLALSHQSGRKG